MDRAFRSELLAIEAAKRLRTLRPIAAVEGTTLTREGCSAINFSGNDYLGLSQDPALKAAATEAIAKWGTGSGASRLISGNLALHEALEAEIAEWKGTAAALLFNSGYHANIGAIPALAEAGDAVLSDALNHASLIDGIRLSRAAVEVFVHCDMESLETALKKTARARRRLIVTESVFSMDGDCTPLLALFDLAERYDAWIYLDEAHAVGVLGPQGVGLVGKEKIPIDRRHRLIQMGTLGKALGSFGAYIAGSRALCDYLVNRARSFIFTTALPPAAIAAAHAAIGLIRRDSSRQDRLWENLRTLHRALTPQLPLPQSAIVPVILGDETQALSASRELEKAGYFVQAIRPPTVPPGTSRLRIALSAMHRETEIQSLAQAIAKATKSAASLG